MSEPYRNEAVVDNLRLSYLEWGAQNPGAPSILCLHGLIASGESFVQLAPELTCASHVIALDLPGNGFSETRRETDVSFSGYAQIVSKLAVALGLERLVVVGHSHGGALALRLAASNPGWAEGIVLLCPAHPFSGFERPLVRFYLSTPGRIFAHLIPWMPAAIQVRGFQQMLGSAHRDERAWFAPYRRALRRRGLVTHILRLLRSWEQDMAALRVDLRSHPLTVPVLLVWGAEDRVVPAGTAGALTTVLPQHQLELLPGVGHLPNEEEPKRCGELICNWIRRIRVPSGRGL